MKLNASSMLGPADDGLHREPRPPVAIHPNLYLHSREAGAKCKLRAVNSCNERRTKPLTSPIPLCPSAPASSLRREHFSPFSGGVAGGVATDPSNPDRFFYIAGSNLVASSISSPMEQQTFFRGGHDSDVTCMAVGPSGRLVASGQAGSNADVCVWDGASGRLIHRLSEHDHGIAAIAFSPDERLLVSIGVARVGGRDPRHACVIPLHCITPRSVPAPKTAASQPHLCRVTFYVLLPLARCSIHYCAIEITNMPRTAHVARG